MEKHIKKEKSEKIPFSFIPPSLLKRISKRFHGIGAIVAKAFPSLTSDLEHAEINYSVEDYGAIAVILAFFYFVLCSIVFSLVASRFFPERAILVGITAGGIIAFLILIQVTMYPRIKVKKKVREIERNLVFALRTMLVQMSSGVTLFDSMNMIAEGNYGALADEFKEAIDEINTGTQEEEALQKMADRNPSLFFRRSLWQMVNGMKAGADVSELMNELVSTMMREETIQIRRYGSDLRMLSLMYMMIGVIIPALGLTLLIMLSSFPVIKLGEIMFWGLLFGVIIGQFMYMGIIKSKRPNLMES
ncbi:MAG: type II secretion system F family protein [archaeon]